MNLSQVKRILFVIVALFGASNLEVYAQQTPATGLDLYFLRFEEAYNIAGQLSNKLWYEPLPYEDIPISFTNLASGEEFLINHPSPDLSKYDPTLYHVHGKAVYKKREHPTLTAPTAFCCVAVSGIPTVFVIENPNEGNKINFLAPETLVTTFLHEGFHYYQKAAGMRAGAFRHISMFNEGKDKYPRTPEHEGDLLVEGKYLYRLASEVSLNTRELKNLISIESKRKTRQNAVADFFENYSFLSEGTAFFIEQEGARILLANGVEKSAIPIGADPAYSYFKGDVIHKYFRKYYQDEYGIGNLLNKLHYPTRISNVLTYDYPLAMIRILETSRLNGGHDWREGLFDYRAMYSNPEQAADDIIRQTETNSLSQKIQALIQVGADEGQQLYRQALSNDLLESERTQIAHRIGIEDHIEDYPDGDGWTYQIIGDPATIVPNVDMLNVDYLADPKKGTTILYFSGIKSIASSRGRMSTGAVTIPLKILLLEGKLIFKDRGHSQEANLNCQIDEVNGHCKTLRLDIPGVTMQATDAAVERDFVKKITTIKIL